MLRPPLNRRTLLTSAAALAATSTALRSQESVVAPSGRTIVKYVPETSDFPYEVQRTEEEWRALLDGDDEAYGVLRKAQTEWPKTTDLWKEAHDGEYHCRGCDLPVYEGNWFEPLNKGWVFFHHAVPHSVMFAIDGPVRQYGQAQMGGEGGGITLTEIHCRRCGSHLGHHLLVSGMYLHCINGTSLKLA